MAVTLKQFQQLAMFETSSWAVWSSEFNRRGCLEAEQHRIHAYMESRLTELRNEVVLLALNRSFHEKKASQLSTTISYPYSNFHAQGHPGDGLLNKMLSHLPSLRGAYMTDLCLDKQSQSRKVTIDSSEVLSRLGEQLRMLAAPRYHVVCFGNAVFNTLCSAVPTAITIQNGLATAEVVLGKNFDLSCYRVIHYSYAVRFNRGPYSQRN